MVDFPIPARPFNQNTLGRVLSTSQSWMVFRIVSRVPSKQSDGAPILPELKEASFARGKALTGLVLVSIA